MVVCSPCQYPGRAREPEYDSAFKVRRVQQQGQFRWKSDRVFLGTVFQGERIGLLPLDEGCFVVYFSTFPIALLDTRKLSIRPWPRKEDFDIAVAEEGDASPSPAPLPLAQTGKHRQLCQSTGGLNRPCQSQRNLGTGRGFQAASI
jgi:hypothetical protein